MITLAMFFASNDWRTQKHMNKNELFCVFCYCSRNRFFGMESPDTWWWVLRSLVDWRELADCLSDSRISDVGNKTVFREEVTSCAREWEADQEVQAGAGDSEAEREQRFQEAQGITMWLTRKHERLPTSLTNIVVMHFFFFFDWAWWADWQQMRKKMQVEQATPPTNRRQTNREQGGALRR